MRKWILALLFCLGIYVLFIQTEDDQVIENFSIPAKAMLLLNADTGKTVYEKDGNEPLPIASMTKLMTQYIVLNAIENGTISWETNYKPSDSALNMAQYESASKLGMKSGRNYSVRELFTAMTVISANDAALALAELVAGSEEDFVSVMNEQARAFNMKKTTFYNPHGLDGSYLGRGTNENNVASAHDVAVLGDRLIKNHPEVLEFTKMTSITSKQGMKMWNTNLLLPGMRMQMVGMDGLKTGYTDAAGSCFTGSGIFDGQRYISVVIGVEELEGEKSDQKFTLTRELIERFVK